MDRAVYGAERGLITGSLLVMTFTYFLAIVRREMTAEFNAFDRLFLRWRGFESSQAAPPEVLAFITDVQTPVVLGVIGLLMALLAFRTRDRVGPVAAPRPAPRRLVRWAAAVATVAVAYGMLWAVKVVPARWMCLAVAAAMIVPAGWTAVRQRRIAQGAGLLVGAAVMSWFFLSRVQADYIWSAELSNLLLMYVGFFGASMATRDGKHIQIDAIRQRIPARWVSLYNAIGGVVTVLFCVLLLSLAVIYLVSSLELGHVHEATRLPKVLDVVPIAGALALMAVRFTALAARDVGMFLRGEVPELAAPGVDGH